MLTIFCQAILFDMDGTLVDSTRCVESIWSSWAERHGLELNHILAASHGRRTLDALREVAPHLNVEQEAKQLEAQELETKEGIEAVPGAAALLRNLLPDRWAVVTSAPRALADLRLHCAGLPIPSTLVCADDVEHGKPSPEGYLKAAGLLGVVPNQCLVVEDTPAGLLAGRAAGMQVLALTTTYPAARLLESSCTRDFCQIQVVSGQEGIALHIP